MTGLVPPHDHGAEQAVLGSCFTRPVDIDELAPLLSPEAFYAPNNRRVWEAMLALNQDDAAVDYVNVASWLQSRDKLEQAGGTTYLVELAESCPTIPDPTAYARTVVHLARLRQAISVCQQFSASGYGEVDDVDKFIGELEASVFELGDKADHEEMPMLRELLAERMNVIGERGQPGKGDFSPTTLIGLNNKIQGYWRGFVHVIAGRPGMGKTAFMLQELLHIARSGVAVVFFSIEQPRAQIAERLMCQESSVDNTRIKSGQLTSSDWTSLAGAAETLSNVPFAIVDCDSLTVSEMRSRTRRELRRLQKRYGQDLQLGAVGIDYLQLMEATQRRGGTRENDVAECVLGVRKFARSFHVPVLLAAQLNRSSTKPPRPPALSDLRESGQIEQDAQAVLFLHNAEGDKTDRIIVAKVREGGTTGEVDVDYDGPTLTFSDPVDPYDIGYDNERKYP